MTEGFLYAHVKMLKQLFPTDVAPPEGIHRDLRAAATLAAACEGRPECLQLLLDSCASSPPSLAQLLDARDSEQHTPLMLAARQGHVDCIRLLLHHTPKPQVLAKDTSGRTALMHATTEDHPACVGLLLEHSPHAQVVARDKRQANALMSAAHLSPASVPYLLAHSPRAQVEALADCGRNALFGAVLAGHAPCMQLLLAHSPDAQVSAVNRHGANALKFAAILGYEDCMRLLLAHSLGVQMAAAAHDDGALAAAAAHARVSCLRLLLALAPPLPQLDRALLAAGRALAGNFRPADLRRCRSLWSCIELLLAHGAMLTAPADSDTDAVAFVRSINQDLAARALVPDMANEAVVGLALAAADSHARR